MQEISKQLADIVIHAHNRMTKHTAESWNARSAPGKWSKKEILGHLIDSAANNHQRFVRAQYETGVNISYDGDAWVKVQDYNDQDITTLLGLWLNYNLHLSHVIAKIPSGKYSAFFKADAKKPVTLEWVVNDYVRHLKHHLDQIQ